MEPQTKEQFRPIACVALHDATARSRVHRILDQSGWTVLDQPTGFHVLQAIAGVIEGDHGWMRPGLIIIDAFSRGCAGTTIAAGLRELGIAIPIVLVTKPRQPLPLVPGDHALRIAQLDDVERIVAEIAPCVALREQLSSRSRGASHARR